MDEGCLDYEFGLDSRLNLVVFLLDVHSDPLIALFMLSVALLYFTLDGILSLLITNCWFTGDFFPYILKYLLISPCL